LIPATSPARQVDRVSKADGRLAGDDRERKRYHHVGVILLPYSAGISVVGSRVCAKMHSLCFLVRFSLGAGKILLKLSQESRISAASAGRGDKVKVPRIGHFQKLAYSSLAYLVKSVELRLPIRLPSSSTPWRWTPNSCLEEQNESSYPPADFRECPNLGMPVTDKSSEISCHREE